MKKDRFKGKTLRQILFYVELKRLISIFLCVFIAMWVFLYLEKNNTWFWVIEFGSIAVILLILLTFFAKEKSQRLADILEEESINQRNSEAYRKACWKLKGYVYDMELDKLLHLPLID